MGAFLRMREQICYEIVTEVRREKNINLAELARKLGTDRRTVQVYALEAIRKGLIRESRTSRRIWYSPVEYEKVTKARAGELKPPARGKAHSRR